MARKSDGLLVVQELKDVQKKHENSLIAELRRLVPETTNEAQEQSVLALNCDLLCQSVDDLRNALDELLVRLVPVSSPLYDAEGSYESPDEGKLPIQSPIAVFINRITGEIYRASKDIQQASGRLDT